MMGHIFEALIEVLEKVGKPTLLGIHVEKSRLASVGADSFVPPGSCQRKDPTDSFVARRGSEVSTEKARPSVPETVIENKSQVDEESITRLRRAADESMKESVSSTWSKTKLSVKEKTCAPRYNTVTVDMLDAVSALSSVFATLARAAEVARSSPLRRSTILRVEAR